MKFGGTSVGNAERIRNLAKIVQSHLSRRPVVVVSAFSGITDGLIEVAYLASKGEEFSAKLDGILDRHYKTMDELGVGHGTIKSETSQLRSFMNRLHESKELTPKVLDTAVSFGERMSSRIVAAYMTRVGMEAVAYDAYDIGLVTDSNFGDAEVLPEAYASINKKLARAKAIPVITGFIAKDKEGDITTLGRGGSDYTGTIVGSALDADEIQIWTDVNGIMTADPKIVSGARTIDSVSYAEASELAFLGAKVLHPKTILPAVEKSIPVRILNTFNPTHKGTVVLGDVKAKSRVISIACQKKIQVINLTTSKMFRMHGFLRQVFEIFDRHKISADMVSTSEVSVSITLDGRQQTGALVDDLKKLARVSVMRDRAKISIVGKGMAHMPGIIGKWSSCLGNMYIEMISSSTSEVNDGFIIEEKYADEAVRKLHKRFFGS